MRLAALIAAVALTSQVYAHGVLQAVQGSNRAVMPGLSVRDGTPRNSGFPASGSEDDTSIIRRTEMGRRSTALGRNQSGPIQAETALARYMGMGGGQFQKRQLIPGGLLGLFGLGAGSQIPPENIQAQTDGLGASMGLPTANDDGTVNMVFHQVNQDGAGPLIVDIDPTSGGTDDRAFVRAAVPKNVPGAVLGLSLASRTKYPITAAMPAGMVCQGTVMGVPNVCILRARNGSLAGPFGGSVMFTQSNQARKRALEYQELQKRNAEAQPAN